MAVKRPVRKLLGKKMGDHIICHPNQDTVQVNADAIDN